MLLGKRSYVRSGIVGERGGAKGQDNAIMSPAAVTGRLAVVTAREKDDDDRSKWR